MTTAEATTVEEWQRAAKSPVTEEDYKHLERVTYGETTAAQNKARELGVPEFALRWVRSYAGTNESGNHLWRGHMPLFQDDDHLYEAIRNQGWRYVEAWAAGCYRSVYRHHEHRLLLTYCEGDLSLTYAPDRATYARALRSARAFYSRY